MVLLIQVLPKKEAFVWLTHNSRNRSVWNLALMFFFGLLCRGYFTFDDVYNFL